MILLGSAPDVSCVVSLLVPGVFGGICKRRFFDTSSSEHGCKSCIFVAGRGGFVMFFRSKYACFEFSQLRLLGELVVATLDNGVIGFLTMCASNGDIFVTPCGVVLKVFF